MNWGVVTPALTVTILAFLVMLLDLVGTGKRGTAYFSLIGIAGALWVSISLWDRSGVGFNGMMALDRYTTFFHVIFLIGTGLTILLSIGYLEREGGNRGEYYVLLLLSTVGMMLMAGGTDLIIIFLGIELLSIAQYILVGFMRSRVTSNESALKYFLLGAFATGFLLYGIALVYGTTGTTNLSGIADHLTDWRGRPSAVLLIGVVLLTVGFGFKVAAAPFHMWVPDVYEGAPTSITAFISTGPKAAGFAAFLRVFLMAFDQLQPEWTGVIWGMAALTMTIGNLIALTQKNIKRMLAYSSIAHAGYVMVAVLAANDLGIGSALFYLLAYTLMNIGAFAVVIIVSRKGEPALNIADYAGLGFRYPLLGLAMAIFMLSLAGVPLTAGFVGKFYIFSAAITAGFTGLVIIGVINSLISVYFYLGVVVNMYMKEPSSDPEPIPMMLYAFVVVILSAIGTIYLGIFPSQLIGLARATVETLIRS
ncbi:MAG: NADH-quinone oxidoreductase subunit N [Candidatus Latescibacteria bacterium]|nr:NADH-quinone oxidoreductase subunit N [Candidatus Latescibacterota bacterium]